MLTACDLWFRHRADPSWLLRGVSLAVAPGRIVGLAGPSGSGKSTLARLLAGFIRPERGVVEVDARATPTGAHPVQLVLQHPDRALNPRWRIGAALAEPGAPPERRDEIEGALLDPAWRERFPHELSGGELQRVNLARAVLAEPRYLIADEITASLDPLAQAEIWAWLCTAARERNIGVLVISHDQALLDAVCDDCLELDVLGSGHRRDG